MVYMRVCVCVCVEIQLQKLLVSNGFQLCACVCVCVSVCSSYQRHCVGVNVNNEQLCVILLTINDIVKCTWLEWMGSCRARQYLIC